MANFVLEEAEPESSSCIDLQYTGISIAFVSSDKSFIRTLDNYLPSTFIASSFDIQLLGVEPLIDLILGLETGHIEAELVVLDSSDLPKDRLQFLIDSFIGAGVPVFIRATDGDARLLWLASSLGAHLFNEATLEIDFNSALAERKHNLSTIKVENAFAESYEKKELSSAATLSAILWENEYTLSHLQNYLKNCTTPVRILDMGCGTGRIEEILLSDPELSQKIESIHAIDFAPMYLKLAKKRLSHFLTKEALDRIHFMRRIAEDTRLPSHYFDIVIGSFGILCFSQFHLTISELSRVLKPSGLTILNGYNRNALAYDFNKLHYQGLFTADIDRENNLMHLGNETIQCFTFDVDEFQTFLKLVGLIPQSDTLQTFPTLYGCMQADYLKALDSRVETALQPSNTPISYQSSALIKDPFKSGFTPVLYEMDRDLSKILKNRGYYFALTALKQE